MKEVYAFPIISTSIWGVSIVGGKILGSNGLDPLEITFFRFLVASIVFVPILLIHHKFQGYSLPRNEDWKNIIGLAVTGVAVNNFVFYTGLKQTDAGLASLLVGLNPLMTMIFAVLLVNERFTTRKVISIFLGLSGVAFVIGMDIEYGKLIGNLLILLAASIWALSFSFSKKASNNGLSSITITGWSIIFGTILLAPFSINSVNGIHSLNLESIEWLLFMGLVSSVFAYIIHYKSIEKLGPSRVAPSTNIIPLSGAIASMVILGERISIMSFFGGFLIIVAVLISQLERNEK